MAKVVLITPTPPDITAFGIRSLSSFLRSKGHQTRLVFLPGSIGMLQVDGAFSYSYSDAVQNDLLKLVHGADLVGFSFFTSYVTRAMQLSKLIRSRTGIPIIWGGIHASSMPEEGLQYADLVCVGEGEMTLLEVMDRLDRRQPLAGISGIYTLRADGSMECNPLRPLIPDISELPFYDYSNDDHFILNRASGRIEPLNTALLEEAMPFMPRQNGGMIKAYRTITDRGCPHRCSYCNVPFLKNLYANDATPFLRARSPERVISEFSAMRDRFPFIKAIHIIDDTFFSRSRSYLEEFAALYKKTIPLPLYAQASPSTLTESKLQLLLDAGLVYVEMGLQTGSTPIRDMYHRPESNETMIEAGTLLHRYRKRLIPPDYHVILDNPWETPHDTLETARLLARLPRPFGLAMSSLLFFPGTELFHRASREGLIKDLTKDVYLKPFYIPPKRNYANFMVYLNTFNAMPRRVLSILLKPGRAEQLAEKQYPYLLPLAYAVAETLRFMAKAFSAVARGDADRIKLFIKRLFIKDYMMVAGRKGK